MQEYLTAIRYAAVKRLKPRIDATIYKIARDPEKSSGQTGDPELRENFDLDVSVKIVADPTLYHPPYKVASHFLDDNGLKAVLQSGRVENTTIQPETVEALRALSRDNGEDLSEGNGVVAVISAFASGMPDLSQAPPAPLVGLPGVGSGGGEGPVLMGQQVGFVKVSPLTVAVDPIRVLVTDHAGTPITGMGDLVKVGSKRAIPSSDEYWGTWAFTKRNERIAIEATYLMPDWTIVKGSSQLALQDIDDWLNPQPPDPIRIQLPIFLPNSFTLTGSTRAKVREGDPAPTRVTIQNAMLGVEVVHDLSDPVEIEVREPIRVNTPLKLTAMAKSEKRRFQGEKSVPLPSKPGKIDFGVITLVPIVEKVRIPTWNPDTPPLAKTYSADLKRIGLTPKPKLGEPPEKKELEYRVRDTIPTRGTEVEKGTDVVVMVHGRFGRAVPHVIGLEVGEAIRILEKEGFKVAKPTIGKPAEQADKESTVWKQSAEPGTEHALNEPIQLVILGKSAPTRTVPRVLELPEQDARREIKEAGLTMRVVPPAGRRSARVEKWKSGSTPNRRKGHRPCLK
jgi:beta-lactam-binding protein with PASTA domain